MIGTDLFMPVTGAPILVYAAVGAAFCVAGAGAQLAKKIRRKR